MAAINSNAVTGNWAAGGSWVGGVAPGPGDTAVIVSGAIITVAADVTVGSKASSIGHAVTVSASGSLSPNFGTLKVAAGVTLTLRGADTTTNTLMLINRFGLFAPQPGSTVLGDVSSDYASIILNKGRFEALGSNGSPITFSVPSGNRNWAGTTVTAQSVSVASYVYDPENHVAFGNLFSVTGGNTWISNAAKTAIGTYNDNSVTFGGAGSGQFTNAVSGIAGIASSGDYYIDCDTGAVFFYFSFPGTAPTAYTVTYTYLSGVLGWGINSVQNTTYNSLLLDYCVFNYFGAHTTSSATGYGLQTAGHLTTGAGGDHQGLQLTNSTVRWCSNFMQLYSPASSGSSGDPILINGNTIYHCRNVATRYPFLAAHYGGSYIHINSNTFNLCNTAVYAIPPNVPANYTNWQFDSNAGTLAECIKGTPGSTLWPGSEIAFNTLTGFGGCFDARMFWGFGGSAHGSRATVHDNAFRLTYRCGQLGSYLDIYSNTFYKSWHHGLTGSSTTDVKITDVNIYNNLWYGKMSQTPYYVSPVIELGYNQRLWVDNVTAAGNTVANQGGAGGGWLDLGDSQDPSQTLITRLVASNNLCDQESSGGPTKYAIRRPATASTFLSRCHIQQIDYNLDFGCSARYDVNNLFTQQGTFAKGGTNYCVQAAGTRNIPGLSLHNPGFPSFSGTKSVSLVVTSQTNITLTWDGSTATQLVLDSGGGGTVSAVNTNSSGLYSGVVTDSGKAWSTTLTSASCYRLRWFWVYSGTAAGYIGCIVNNTATTLTVAPGFPSQFITGMTGSGVNPVVCTAANHGYSAGQVVFVQGCFGNTILNNAYWTIASVTTNTFTITATGNGTYNTGTLGYVAIVPDTTSLYAIVESELTLTGTGSVTSGSNTVQCGIYLPDLPTSNATYTDTGISFADSSKTGSDPKMVAPNGATAASYKVTAGGAGIDAGTGVNAPSTDYFGTARPINSLYDIGFFEFPTAVTASMAITLAGDTIAGAITAAAAGNTLSSGITLGADTAAGVIAAGAGGSPSAIVAGITLRGDTIAGTITAVASPSAIQASLLLPGDTVVSVIQSGASSLSFLHSTLTLADDLVIAAVLAASGSVTTLTAYPDPFTATSKLLGS